MKDLSIPFGFELSHKTGSTKNYMGVAPGLKSEQKIRPACVFPYADRLANSGGTPLKVLFMAYTEHSSTVCEPKPSSDLSPGAALYAGTVLRYESVGL